MDAAHHSISFCFFKNQTVNLDRSVEDVLEHFVYLPKQSTANPQDIPFFLSTRLADANAEASKESSSEEAHPFGDEDPVKVVARYENRAAELAAEYEDNMVRF
jgi:hypothetical protein